jgi:hypothetical protein
VFKYGGTLMPADSDSEFLMLRGRKKRTADSWMEYKSFHLKFVIFLLDYNLFLNNGVQGSTWSTFPLVMGVSTLLGEANKAQRDFIGLL